MKSFFTTILVVLGIYTTAFSQTKNTTEFGFNVGYNAATATTANGQADNHYRSGVNVGFSADYYFSDRWSIKGKLYYDQKGWNNGFMETDNVVIATNNKFDYLTIPVMANWHFGKTRNWYLNFGPYVGILLSAKETAMGTDLKHLLNTTDIGFDAGIGIKFPVAEKAKLFIELNGQGGATNLIKNNTDLALRNSVSSVNVGINF